MVNERYARFKDISVSERILNTVFLLTIGPSLSESALDFLKKARNTYYKQ